MAVQVVVKGGPEAGRSYSLSAGVTHIGRGPNAQIRLVDPSLQGTITVETSGGVVRVRHDLPHAIYLNRQSFPPGESRTWFHGHQLQPTADTVLELRLPGEAVEKPAANKTGQWILAAGLGVVAVFLFAFPSDSSGGRSAGSHDKPEAVQAGLLRLATTRAKDPSATALPKLFAAARALELRQRPTEAFEAYTRFRDALLYCQSRPRRAAEILTADEEAALEAAKQLLNARLIELSPRKTES